MLDTIKGKLEECPNISYKKIIMAAGRENKKEVALPLLQNEDSVKDQIPILVNMKEYKSALHVAISNCEADAVYGIISAMRKEGKRMTEIAGLCTEVKGFALQLLSYIYQRQLVNPSDKELKSFLHEIRNPEVLRELQSAGIGDAEECKTLREILHSEKYSEIRHKMIMVKGYKNTHMRIKQYIENYYNFLEIKATNIQFFNKKGVNLGQDFTRAESLFSTITHIISRKELDRLLEALITQLKVEPKFVLMIKLRAIAKAKDWAKFSDIAKKEKPKLPPQCYARMCMEFGNKELAVAYIKMINSFEDKINMLIELEYPYLYLIVNIKKL